MTIRVAAVPLLVLPVLLTGCTFLPPADDTGAPLQDRSDRVASELAALRDLDLLADVPAASIDKDVLEERMARQIDVEWTDHDTAVERAYKVLGLYPEDLDVKAWAAGFLRDQVGGYYDSEQGAFYTVEDPASAMDVGLMELFVLSHELTHALEDQHFDLDRDREGPGWNADAELAFSCLVEGSAMEAAADHTLWRLGLPMSSAGPLLRWLVAIVAGVDRADLVERMDSQEVDAEAGQGFSEAPGVVQAGMMFPYVQGWGFVNRLRAEYGWQAVDAAYADPPESTEQVLFPERYFEYRDRPVRVELPDPPAGVTQRDTDTLGLLGTAVLLNPAGEGWDDASGWDGDTFALWETDHGDAVAWVTVWDREGQAEDFAHDVRAALAARVGVGTTLAVAQREDVVAVVVRMPEADAEAAVLHLLDGVTLHRAPDDQAPPAWWWRALTFPASVRAADRSWTVGLLGDWLLKLRSHDQGHHFSIGSGEVLLSENNPDRTSFWVALGLLGFTTDRTLDYTVFRIPFALGWHVREAGSHVGLALDAIRYDRREETKTFDLLWGGLLRVRWGGVPAGERVRFLFLPVPGL